MRQLLLTLFALFLTSAAVAKDDPPAPGYPLPANTPGEMVTELQKNFVEFNPVRLDPRLGMLPQYALYKAAQDDEARVASVRESLQSAKLDEEYRQVILANMGQIAPAANVSVVEKAWTDEETYNRTRDSGGMYFVMWPFHGFQLKLQGVGAWLDVDVMRVEKTANGKFRQTVLRSHRLQFVNAFENLRNGASTMTARVWMAMPPAEVEAMLRDSIEQVRQMLVYEFSAEGLAEHDREVKGEKFEYRGMTAKARQLRQGEGWLWYRTSLFSYLMGERFIPEAKLPPPVPADDPRVMNAARKR